MRFSQSVCRIPVLKRLVPSTKRALSRLRTRDGFVLKRYAGSLFLLNVNNYVDRQIALFSDFEKAQLDCMADHMRRHGCDLFVDVGANFGLYSIMVANAGLADTVLAFEPDRRNLLQLGANILLNRLVGRITVVEKAVSATTGSIAFRPGPAGSTGQSRVDEVGNETVACVALDDAIDASDARIFVKIDIEGHEQAAITGMAACARRNRMFVQVESFTANYEATAAALARLGFSAIAHIGDDHYFANYPAS